MTDKNDNRALAFIETDGRTGIIASLDAMAKKAKVDFVRRISLGRGIMAVVFQGEVGAACSALQAGKEAAENTCKIIAVNVIPGPHSRISGLISQKSGKDERF